MKHKEKKVKPENKNEQSISELNIYAIGIPEEKEKYKKYIFEKIMAENFPYLIKTINSQIQEAQQTLSRKKKKTIPKNISIKLLTTSDKVKKKRSIIR